MKLSRHSLLAAVVVASGLVFTMLGSAQAQRAVYRTVSGHGYGHGGDCPCPCPTDEAPAEGEEAPAEENGEVGEDLPEVADLTSDAAFAGASQSAAPNAIGDSLYTGYNVTFFNGDFAQVDPAGGRRFKTTHNNSAIPQTRVFFNYNYFNNAFINTSGGAVNEIDAHQYEIGGEKSFWCNLASIQVRVPVNDSFSTDQIDTFPLATDTQLGNVQLAVKAVLCQNACTTLTGGVGADLPTADDFVFDDGVNDLSIENEAVLLSPFVAALHSLDSCTYVQGFAQVCLPLSENAVTSGAASQDLTLPTVMYVDLSLGRWLRQDCCGNGLIAIAELHYSNALDDDRVVVGGNSVANGDWEMLNATIGASIIHNCWYVTPAVVLPLLDGTDRAFDYELALQIGRRF